jgi:hypothetical protein
MYFPIDILKQLTKTVVKKEFPTDTRLFLDLLIGFLNVVFTHGQCPPGVLSFYDAGEAIRLQQGATKVRPIGKATTYRKIVDVAQQLPHREDLQTAFGDIQYCGASFGTERMQNSMNIHLATQAELIAGIIAIQQSKGPDFGAKLNMNKRRILLQSCLDDKRALLLQSHFHDTFQIPRNRIHIHPDNISDPADKANAKLHNGDVILGIPASPFAEFIDAFVSNQVEEISVEWRLASHRLKDEPHHLWYLLKHILASKFTCLFRGIPPPWICSAPGRLLNTSASRDV